MKRNVLIFTEVFANGGIERIMSYIDDNIDKEKYNIKLLCTINKTTIFNNKIVSISNNKNISIVKRLIITIFNISKYSKNMDVIHINIHSSIGLIYAYLLKNKCNNIIIHAHNSGFDNDKFKIKMILSMIFKKFFSSCKYKYIACSKATAFFCFKKNIKYKIISNEIDTKKFVFDKEVRKDIRKKYNLKNRNVVIGNIGRLTHQKNQLLVIDIFNELVKINDKYKLFIVGDGPLKNQLLKRVNIHELNNKVIFIDSSKNVRELYMMFDIYLMPSLYEGYGITVKEALSSSLPCFISSVIKNGFTKEDNLYSISLEKSAKEWANLINKKYGIKRKKKIINENNYIKKLCDIYEK